MMRIRVLVSVAAATLAAGAARAGPAHVLSSQTLDPAPADATYAVSPELDASAQEALRDGLRQAGLVVVPVEAQHAYLVTAQAGSGALCSSSCSSLTLHDDARLDDYYRHVAVVTAQPSTGARFDRARPVAWFTVLQSDGLSPRSGDYLPALLRYGGRAYGRNSVPQAPPRLAPAPRVPPPNARILPANVISSPGD